MGEPGAQVHMGITDRPVKGCKRPEADIGHRLSGFVSGAIAHLLVGLSGASNVESNLLGKSPV